MPDPGHTAAALALAATITFTLRAAPFAVVQRLRSAPMVADLGRRLPAGVLTILVVYLLKDTPVTAPAVGLAHLVPVVVTVGVHFWRRNMVLSMAAGTVSYAVALAVAGS